ncbi:MAG: prepilin-type N-terminal cleavage/methylation domain-containing protein, partial [Phycisphaerales bacterium]
EPRASARAVLQEVKTLCTPITRPPTVHYDQHRLYEVRRRPAFSLLELMIGIIILGLGMVMVATMFPVGWNRARTLREYTVQKAVTANAHATVKSLVRVSSPTFNASSLLGDLIYDPYNPVVISTCPDFYPQIGDTWVHALNLENIRVADRQFVSEDPWSIQDSDDQHLFRLGDPRNGELAGDPVCENSFFRKQISFHQRVYPPLRILPDNADNDQKRLWDDTLATRRFSWAVFHRLRELIDPEDPDATRNVRAFDVYFVTLRRPNPTYRYARQSPAAVPDACDLTRAAADAVAPTALPPDNDVMFPVPWRVQVWFPDTLVARETATGIPTEIMAPPPGVSGTPQVLAMWAQMFPTGIRFIDEITGDIYSVVKRRVTGDNAEQAHLTLDREVSIEDLDLTDTPAGDPDPRCDPNLVGALYPCELLRTVWVFPPAVLPTRDRQNVVVFEGSQPVADIEVQTVKIPPTE